MVYSRVRGGGRSGSYNPTRVASRIFRDLVSLKTITVYISGEYTDTIIEASRKSIKVSIPDSICSDLGKLALHVSSVRIIKYIYPEISWLGRMKTVMEDKKLTVILSSIVQAAILITLFRLNQSSPILLIVLGILLASISIGDALISSLINRDTDKRRNELEELDRLSMVYPAYKTASSMLDSLIIEAVRSSCNGGSRVLNVSGFILRLKRIDEGEARVYEYRVESAPGIVRIKGYT